jgi:hypothetical protein
VKREWKQNWGEASHLTLVWTVREVFVWEDDTVSAWTLRKETGR